MIPSGKGLPRYANERETNIIRGKAMVGHQSVDDIWTLLDHIAQLEELLDEADAEDMFGTEGWRHHLGDR
jgi:hypothetical protein